jgi:AraC-like DNA-binding protein
MKASFEKILTTETSSFKAFAYEQAEFDAPWHYHPEYELTYIVSSTGVRYTGIVFENFDEDDLVLLGPNLPHCWKNTADQKAPASAIVIHWNEELLGNGWLNQNEFTGLRRLFQHAAKGLKFPSDFAIQMKPKLLALLEHSGLDRMIMLLQVFRELASCVGYRELCKHDFNYTLRITDHERINTIHQFVRNHFHEKITLTSISTQVHMSDESFSRFFSRLMRKPFFTFLNEFRINAACSLLIETDLAVTEIAYRCGFESMPFFFRQFTRYKKVTPNHFRKIYRGIEMV